MLRDSLQSAMAAGRGRRWATAGRARRVAHAAMAGKGAEIDQGVVADDGGSKPSANTRSAASANVAA